MTLAAPSSQSVLLDIVSIDLPETEPSQSPELSSTVYPSELETDRLKLTPGDTSEIIISLENLETRPLNLTCEVTGNFPLHWCQMEMSQTQLLPGERRSVILSFQVEDNFFENSQGVSVGDSLRLNYFSRFNVYGSFPGTPTRLLEFADFNLFVRSRSPYVNFLPQIYREIDFVGRFLKIIETTFHPDVQILDTLWAYLDPLTAPESLLPFLAHWVGWPLEDHLTLEQQRRLIRHALEIYRWRGTKRGLRFYLHLATGLPLDEHIPEEQKHITIVENFTQGAIFGDSHLGENTFLGGGKPFHFEIRLRGDPNLIDESLIQTVIEAQKPAFCTYDLTIEPEVDHESGRLLPEP